MRLANQRDLRQPFRQHTVYGCRANLINVDARQRDSIWWNENSQGRVDRAALGQAPAATGEDQG